MKSLLWGWLTLVVGLSLLFILYSIDKEYGKRHSHYRHYGYGDRIRDR